MIANMLNESQEILSKATSITPEETLKLEALSIEIEKTIDGLHGDLRSIERQLEQRRIVHSVEGQLNNEQQHPSVEENYNIWKSKIRRAFSYKRDQVKTLERVLGSIRDKTVNRKYIYVNLFIDIAIAADNLVADIDDAKDTKESKSELTRLLDVIDRSWPEWS